LVRRRPGKASIGFAASSQPITIVETARYRFRP
jgi:hypothetical protein